MSDFSMPVNWYMSAPMQIVRHDIDINALHHRFIKYGVSSLPVVDEDDNLVGMVSRTDLLRCSFDAHGEDTAAPLLSIPDQRIAEIMTKDVLTVDHEATVADAARTMIEGLVHRVYVTKDDRLSGVLSARDVLPAIVDLRLSTPVGDFMSTPLFVIACDEPLDTAMTILAQAQVSGVVILGSAGPLGVFTQADALLCRNLQRRTQIHEVMDTGIISISASTPMYLAADQTVKTNSQRVVVTDADGVRGIATALDFVRAAV